MVGYESFSAAAVWTSVSLIGLLNWSQEKTMQQLLRHKITERPPGSFIGDPSAILEGNKMSGRGRMSHLVLDEIF